MRFGAIFLVLLAGCRIETATPKSASGADCSKPSGDVWIYTSMYREVVDRFDPLLKQRLPQVNVHWFQAGTEKVLARLEAELQAGGTQADVLLVSNPFLYRRLKDEGRLQPYVPPGALRAPRSLVDDDGAYAPVRLSTMVMVKRAGATAPDSFAGLVDPRFKDKVALGDPLSSGTAFTWSVFLKQSDGVEVFQRLRDNGARLAGGNAAVLQKIEGGEADVGVLLLENALAAQAKGSKVEVVWPKDGAVVIPGDAAIFKTTRNLQGAQAVIDELFSDEGQRLIVGGDMHAVDPRLPGPGTEPALDELMKRSRPWSPALEKEGVEQAETLKTEIQKVFAK
ncbi:MAG: ABC transporter substrate-binding protein [Myxococcaceae bacterium]